MATPQQSTSSSTSSYSITISKQWNGSSITEGHRTHITLSLLTESQQLLIEVDAPFHDDLPPPQASGPAREKPLIGLWNFEVVEIFISDGARENYLEVNLGPHGHYFAKVFTPHEQLLVDADGPAELRHYVRDGSKRWASKLRISTWSLPEPDADFDDSNPLAVRWFGNFYAIYGTPEKRTYLAHQPVPGSRPNFHQPQVFAPFILTESESCERRSSRCGRYSTMSLDQRSGGSVKGSSASSLRYVVGRADMLPPAEDITRRLLVDLSVENINVSNLDGVKGYGTDAGQNSSYSDKDDLARGRRVSVSEAIEEIRESENCLKELPQSSPSGLNKLLSVFKKEPKKAPDLLQFMLPEESILVQGLCWKRKGWSWHRRILVLTTKTRLLYLTPSGRFRGQVPWSFSNSIRAIEISGTKFDIELKDKSRVYHFTDEQFGSERWITAINKIAQAMQSYYETTRNRPASLNVGLPLRQNSPLVKKTETM